MTADEPGTVDSTAPEGREPSAAPTVPPVQEWAQPAAQAQPTYIPPVTPATPVRRRRPGLWFGVILILIGVALIVERIIPGLSLWTMWPLIIVAAGLYGMFKTGSEGRWRVNRITEGLVTVVIGAILFGNTTGALPWSVWLSVFSLWPLLLVSAGIDIIGKSLDNVWIRVLSSLVVLAGLLYGALVMPAGTFSLGMGLVGREAEPFELSEPVGRGVTEGAARIEGAVGTLTVTDGDDRITASGRSPYGEPRFEVDRAGNQVDAEISFAETGVYLGSRGNPRMDIELARNVAWSLEIDTGVSSLEADLSDLDVRELLVSAGVSESEIKLGDLVDEVDRVSVSVEAGVSTVTIKVPRDVQLRVSAEGGLSTVGLPDGTDTALLGETSWRSTGFDEDEPFYDISFKGGIAGVSVEYY